jgi:hypothetical protein
MLVDGVDRVGQRRVGGGGQNIRVRAGGDDIRRVAAARPSVWKVWMVRPPMAASVSSTNPDSFSVSLCSAT